MQILLRSTHPTKTNFVGEQVTQVIRPGGQTARTQQRVFRSGSMLRVNYRNGQVLFDDGEKQLIYIPRQNVVEQSPSRLGGPEAKSDLRAMVRRQVIAIEQLPDDAVAGRPTYVIQVRPLNKPRVQRKFWIDKESYLQLRLDELQENGAQVSTQFLSINFGVEPPTGTLPYIPPPTAQIVARGERRPIPPARALRLAVGWGGPLRPRFVPPGYEWSGFFLHNFRGREVLVAVYRNPQEQSTLSVFQGPAMGLEGVGQMDSATRLRVLTGKRGQANVAVVGPLPDGVLRRVLESIPDP